MLKHELGFLPFEPLGLETLRALLDARGHKTKLYDCLAEHPEKIVKIADDLFRCGSSDKDILKAIKKFQPDVVMITGMFFAQADSFAGVARLAKQVSPQIIVVGGGNFASLYFEKILADDHNFDLIVIGDGEETTEELMENLDDFQKVAGLAYRNKKGEIVVTPARKVKMNLDELPLPYRDFGKVYNYSKHVGYNYTDKFDFKKGLKRFLFYQGLSLPGVKQGLAAFFNYRHKDKPKALFMPSACISTSRGCPNRCTFCAVHRFHQGIYRMRSSASVLEEMESLVKHGVRGIIIVDDNFTVSKTRTIEICQGIIKRRYRVRLLTPSGLFLPSLDKETLEYLYRAGLREIPFAVENGNQEFLQTVIKKNLNLEQVREIVKIAKDIGFHTTGFFIFGYPGETRAMMIKTLRFAFESGFHLPRFYILQPFPGTEIYEIAKQTGVLKDFDFSRLKAVAGEPRIATTDFSLADVKKIFNLAYDILRKRNYNEVKDKIPELLGWG